MKRPTWKQLREVVDNDEIVDFLKSTPEKWRNAIALALSVSKWSPARGKKQGAGGSLCGLCARHCFDDPVVSLRECCDTCPVFLHEGLGCGETDSPWANWVGTELGSKESKRCADELYALLVELYREEYNR